MAVAAPCDTHEPNLGIIESSIYASIVHALEWTYRTYVWDGTIQHDNQPQHQRRDQPLHQHDVVRKGARIWMRHCKSRNEPSEAPSMLVRDGPFILNLLSVQVIRCMELKQREKSRRLLRASDRTMDKGAQAANDRVLEEHIQEGIQLQVTISERMRAAAEMKDLD